MAQMRGMSSAKLRRVQSLVASRPTAVGALALSLLCLGVAIWLLSTQRLQADSQAAPERVIILRDRHILVRPQEIPKEAASVQEDPKGDTEPVPIPGGIVIPPLIHIFAPGPASQGFQGLDVEPNGITNFRGFAALGYLAGTATGSDGITYNLSTDMRVFQGEYVSFDGTPPRHLRLYLNRPLRPQFGVAGS